MIEQACLICARNEIGVSDLSLRDVPSLIGGASSGTPVASGGLVDAERLGGRVRAAHIRERMRALGPTVRLDLGKQAEGKGAGFAAPEGE